MAQFSPSRAKRSVDHPSKSCFWNSNSHYQTLPPRVKTNFQIIFERYEKQTKCQDSTSPLTGSFPILAANNRSAHQAQKAPTEARARLRQVSKVLPNSSLLKYAYSDNTIRNIFERLSSWVHILVFIFLSIGAHRSECLIRIQLLIKQEICRDLICCSGRALAFNHER